LLPLIEPKSIFAQTAFASPMVIQDLGEALFLLTNLPATSGGLFV
jgi:hypothetical protein